MDRDGNRDRDRDRDGDRDRDRDRDGDSDSDRAGDGDRDTKGYIWSGLPMQLYVGHMVGTPAPS